MIFEGVNFSEETVRAMTRAEFESRHVGILWPDRDEAARRKMLGQAYALIVKPGRKTGNKRH